MGSTRRYQRDGRPRRSDPGVHSGRLPHESSLTGLGCPFWWDETGSGYSVISISEDLLVSLGTLYPRGRYEVIRIGRPET